MEVYPVIAVVSVSGIVFTAFYVLRMLARVLFGPRTERFTAIPDTQKIDLAPLFVLGVFLVGLGVFPGLLMNVVDSGVAPLVPLFELLNDAPTILGGGM